MLVLSYLLSFIFSGFSTLVLLYVDENSKSVIMPTLFVFIGSVSIVLRRKRNGKDIGISRPSSLSRNIDILAIALCLLFYTIFFYSIYPNASLITGTDASRHYNNSIILSRTPGLYNAFSYLLFHAYEVTLHALSGLHQSIASFQTIQVVLNIFLPLSVYALAKRFLAGIDRRIPAISTIFYTILSNFSFIYFTQLKLLSNNGQTEIQLLATVAEKAFNGTQDFAQPFAFFTPQAVSFTIFIVVLLSLRVHSIPKSRFVPLLSVLILVMYLTHVAEAVIFVILIGVYSLLSKKSKTKTDSSLRLDDALFSSLIAFILASIVVAYKNYLSGLWN